MYNSGMPPDVAVKIAAYKLANTLPSWKKDAISRECRSLEKKLGVSHIPRRQYVFLRKIAETMKIGDDLDLTQFALDSGYSRTRAENPAAMILKNIPDKVYSELVGFSRKDVEFELTKIMRQDDDLPAKMRALELAAKITGITDEGKIQVQINTLGFTVAD